MIDQTKKSVSTSIGTVEIYYEKGIVKNSKFIPSEFKSNSIDFKSEKLIENINKNVDENKNKEIVLNQAKKIFSNWFNQLTQIELSDTGIIEAKLISCKTYGLNNIFKKCVIEYYFTDTIV